MFTITKRSIEWGGQTLTLETGKVARQADGAVMVTYGETVLLCTAVAKKQARDDIDFFPLTVHYQEKAFAAGKIPGGFFKREGRPSEKETLISRLIDRPIRPMFNDGFYNETQIICTLLSFDAEHNTDVLAIIGASAALAISGIPFNGPVAAAKVAYIDDEYVLNPTAEAMEDSRLELVLAGTEQSVLMVESEASELSEDVMLGSVTFAHEAMQPVIKLINEFAGEAGKERWNVEIPDNSALAKKVTDIAQQRVVEAYKETVKQTRRDALDTIRQETIEQFAEELENADHLIGGLFKNLEKDVVRNAILDNGTRIDQRHLNTVRDIVSEVSTLPKTHGSALFTRGETQALAVVTLGTGQDEQIIDSLAGDMREHFMLHYNFPPYSVGEASMMRAPGRREIGHGKLAWRALHALMPQKEDFPYTIRVVSEVTESNGSSSMATVCGTSLALMDAGVPLRAPVAGIAMGLIKDGERFAVLSDILGDEDHLGDMDFKVAGTESGITALQMDIKIQGITTEIMRIALDQAKEGRLTILEKMAEAITSSRETVNKNAPVITNINIDKDKIRDVIGTGGKVIREICETTGAKIDIEDDGSIRIAGPNAEACDAALKIIQGIVFEPEVGTIYDGKVVRVVDFGAFVNFQGRDGLVHISELVDKRVESVRDIVSEGNEVKVKVIGVDNRGKIKLSMRVVNQETGEDISDSVSAPSSKENKSQKSSKPSQGKQSSEAPANNERGEPQQKRSKLVREKKKYYQ